MAEAETTPSTSDQAAEPASGKPVVKPVSIGIQQAQKIDPAHARPLDLWTRIAQRVYRLPNPLPGKVWVPAAFERRRDELLAKSITDASHALHEESKTDPDCAKELKPRYIEELLGKLNLWPKAYRNSPKKRRRS